MMNNSKMIAVLTVGLVAQAFAGDYYWDKTLTQSSAAPLDWNQASSWRVGGNSEWDPKAENVPVRGQDIAIFRGVNAYAQVNQATEMPATYLWCESNRYDGDPSTVDIRMTPLGSLHYGFTEMVPRCSLSFSGGSLLVDEGMELYANQDCRLSFSELAMTNLTVQMFRHDGTLHLHNVTGDKIRVNAAVYNDADNANNLVVIDGPTEMGDFVLGGHYYNSKVYVTNGTKFASFSFSRNDATRYPDGAVLSNLFYTAQVDLGTVYFGAKGKNEPFYTIPEYTFDFSAGTRLAFSMWDPVWLSGRDNTFRFSGDGTYATNFTVNVRGNGSKLEVLDGAFVESRRLNLGYEETGAAVSARVAGVGTKLLVQPNDMELESVLVVGSGNNDNPSVGNTLVVEEGAIVQISTNRSFKGGTEIKTRLTGLMIGKESSDDDNAVIVRSGAVVSNDFWTGIGGSFCNAGARGGKNNLLRIDNATYLGGLAYNDVWDTTLYVGGEYGYSNRLEVVNGGYAKFSGCMSTARGPSAGGAQILVDNATLEIASKFDIYWTTLAYGNPHIVIGGSNGVFRVGGLTFDPGWNNADLATAFEFDLKVGKGRRAEHGALVEVTGAMYDFNKDAFVGKCAGKDTLRVALEIDPKWATSGNDNTITLISAGYGNGDYRYTESGVNAIKDALAATVAGTGCALSTTVDGEAKAVKLQLTAGSKSGLIVVVR